MHYSNVVEINFVESPGFKKIIEDGYSPVEIIRNITRISPETVFVPGEGDIEECIREADKRMYEMKVKMKAVRE